MSSPRSSARCWNGRWTSGSAPKLGAHYTPRAYVERLVVPTIVEPLRADWEEALAHAHELEDAGDRDGALKAIKDFHHTLCTTRVLDPACGTGNFLYVALELMKRLEGEVLEALDDLGEDAPRLAMKGETVDPSQFYGLELNPRAVAIADLVLWIGYLKWQLRTVVKADSIAEPVLHAYGTIREQDAILAYDKQELLRDDKGRPLSRWDGETMKQHPITGEEIPDPDATVELCSLREPAHGRVAGSGRVHRRQSAILSAARTYARRTGRRLRRGVLYARPNMPGGADYVMHSGTKPPSACCASRRKIRQFAPLRLHHHQFRDPDLSRRVDRTAHEGEGTASLAYAVPDHPWIEGDSDKRGKCDRHDSLQ